MDLQLKYAPKDLMSKFIDCLIRLPNLRTLEVFSASHISPITRGLIRKSARFHTVRELVITNRTAKFIGNCPNVETVMAPDLLNLDGAAILISYKMVLKNLKRVIGIAEKCVSLGEPTGVLSSALTEGSTIKVVQEFPDLQEIGIKDSAEPPVRPPVLKIPGSHPLLMLAYGQR